MATLESLYGSPGSWKAFSSASNRLRWVCIPDSLHALERLGHERGVETLPVAASRTTKRNVITLSAIDSASVWRRSISCWLGESSWNEYSTGMPIASSVWIVRLRSEPETSAVVRSKYEPVSSGVGRPSSPGVK